MKLRVIAVLGLSCLPACVTTPPDVFLHKEHRLDYGIQEAELKGLRFYISTDVLARQEVGPETSSSPDGVILVAAETPGVVTEVGPDWLRVSFEKGGRGVPFLARMDRGQDSAYWLATELPGGGFEQVRQVPERTLAVQDRKFVVVRGYNARLEVDGEELTKLIESRRHIKGRTE
jgi:hypothetical protein